MANTKKQTPKQKITMEVKLHINQRLFADGVITAEMYQKAQEIILKG